MALITSDCGATRYLSIKRPGSPRAVCAPRCRRQKLRGLPGNGLGGHCRGGAVARLVVLASAPRVGLRPRTRPRLHVGRGGAAGWVTTLFLRLCFRSRLQTSAVPVVSKTSSAFPCIASDRMFTGFLCIAHCGLVWRGLTTRQVTGAILTKLR